MNEGSVKIEIDIVALFLGFLFLIISIVMTVPNDLLEIMNRLSITESGQFFRVTDITAVYTIGNLLLLFGSLLLYLIFLNKTKLVILALARTIFVITSYFMVKLSIVFATILIFRLVGDAGLLLINPLYSYINILSEIIVIFIVAFIWYYWAISQEGRLFFKRISKLVLKLVDC